MSIYDNYEYREPHPDTLAAQAERQMVYREDKEKEAAILIANLRRKIAEQDRELARLHKKIA